MINYTYTDFDIDCFKIRDKLVMNNFDMVVAPSRGGLPLGVKLSHLLNIPLGIIEYQTRDNITGAPKLVCDPLIGKAKNILLVDEITDSGVTILETCKLFNNKVTVFTLFGKKEFREKFGWDYTNELLGDWVVFPWEETINLCKNCKHGEPCYNDSENFTHCNINDRSFSLYYSCGKFIKRE